MMQLYDRIIDPDLMVRRINICACNLIYENAGWVPAIYAALRPV